MKFSIDINSLDVISASIYLAMTEDRESERELILKLKESGYQCVATMASGHNSTITDKATRAIIGAALNENIIEKTRLHLHPLVHALHDCVQSSRLNVGISQHCNLKFALVRKKEEIAVSCYGDISIIELSGHKTVGSGYHILSD